MDAEVKMAEHAQDALRQLKIAPNDSKAIEILREAHRVVTQALSTDRSSDAALISVRSEVALGVPALIDRVKEGVSPEEGINYMLRVFEDLKSKTEGKL
jgi:hypothetical protein